MVLDQVVEGLKWYDCGVDVVRCVVWCGGHVCREFGGHCCPMIGIGIIVWIDSNVQGLCMGYWHVYCWGWVVDTARRSCRDFSWGWLSSLQTTLRDLASLKLNLRENKIPGSWLTANRKRSECSILDDEIDQCLEYTWGSASYWHVLSLANQVLSFFFPCLTPPIISNHLTSTSRYNSPGQLSHLVKSRSRHHSGRKSIWQKNNSADYSVRNGDHYSNSLWWHYSPHDLSQDPPSVNLECRRGL